MRTPKIWKEPASVGSEGGAAEAADMPDEMFESHFQAQDNSDISQSADLELSAFVLLSG